MQKQTIFMEGNVPSLKNSKQYIPGRVTKGGKKIPPRLIPSKTVQNYLKEFEYQFQVPKLIIKNTPVVIAFHFIRLTRHKFDFGNACQILQDLMVKYNWIEDDNMDCLIPVPLKLDGKWYSYDKERPGVIIRLVENWDGTFPD